MMTNTLLPLQSSWTQLREKIAYPEAGVVSKVLIKDNCCQYTLFCLAAGTGIIDAIGLVEIIIVAVAKLMGEERVVLTGGCFQNKYLTERAIKRLRKENFCPYWLASAYST